MPPDYTYAIQFGPKTEAAKQAKARQLLRTGNQTASAPVNSTQCVLYKVKGRMRLVKLHSLLATLESASASANPAQIMLDLVAYNSGYLRNLAAFHSIFRVCGRARNLLVAALDANATGDNGCRQVAALLRIKAHIDTDGVLQGWYAAAGANNSYCSWTGVSCTTSGQVSALQIWSAQTTRLKGKLPPAAAFQGLSSLTTFALAEQPGISGTLPADWSRLQQLQDIE